MSLLERVRIASPCPVKWEQMVGDDDRVRFCDACSLNVYDLSAMTAAEARLFVAGSTGRTCIRLFQRSDGTVITSDCPVGRTLKWGRRIRSGVVRVFGGLGAFGVVLAMFVTIFGDNIRRFFGASAHAGMMTVEEPQRQEPDPAKIYRNHRYPRPGSH